MSATTVSLDNHSRQHGQHEDDGAGAERDPDDPLCDAPPPPIRFDVTHPALPWWRGGVSPVGSFFRHPWRKFGRCFLRQPAEKPGHGPGVPGLSGNLTGRTPVNATRERVYPWIGAPSQY